MHKHTSFVIMAAVLLPAIITLTIYTVSRANAQGNETSATGAEEHNMTNAAGAEEHNMTNAAGAEEHNMTNAAGGEEHNMTNATGPLENLSLSTSRTHVEVPPAEQHRIPGNASGGPV